MTIKALLNLLASLIINPIIILGFFIATAYLFYGIGQMIMNADGKDLESHKKNVIFGVVGLFVMFSVYGILRFVLATFAIPCTFYFC